LLAFFEKSLLPEIRPLPKPTLLPVGVLSFEAPEEPRPTVESLALLAADARKLY
jgi:hypothetical protein